MTNDFLISILTDAFQAFCLVGWITVKVYQLALELRFLVQWFLNINPYFEPFQTLWFVTNPILTFGRPFYPKLLGLDITPMINYRLLISLEMLFDRGAHGIDIYNYYKFLNPADVTTPRITPISDLNLPDYIN